MAKSTRSADPHLESYLLGQHGPLMHGRNLWLALGYVSAQAFRKAVRFGTVPVHTFTIETRRGRFAKTRDVAAWIATLDAAEDGNSLRIAKTGECMPPG